VTGAVAGAKRLEFRCPDSSGNPYLSFAAMMMAGVDGIRNKIEPPTPVDKDLYELPPEEAAAVDQAPTSLESVIDKLEEDHEYLTEGDVFTEDLIETWISLKRDSEIAVVNVRPTPAEFELYFDC
jgi:glutamine synthetase